MDLLQYNGNYRVNLKLIIDCLSSHTFSAMEWRSSRGVCNKMNGFGLGMNRGVSVPIF